MKKDRKIRQYGLYTAIFILLCMIILLPFLIRGNSLIANADGYNQAFPVFCYARQYWINILKGKYVFFDFTVGLGEDVISTLSVHGLFDMIQVPISLLFPVENQEVAYGLSIVVKMYLSGIAFLVYIKKYISNMTVSVLGAILYVFNAYSLFWGTYFPTFFLPYICLPLILHGIDELILEKRKISFFIIGGVILQGLNGYYFLYMIVVLAVLYFFVMICSKDICKNKIVMTGFAVLNGVIGVGLSSVVIIPSIMSLLSSSREYGTGIDWRVLQNGTELLEHFSNLATVNIYASTSTLAMPVLGGCLFYFLSDVKQKKLKILGIFLFIAYFSPVVGSIMHGFSYSTDRWHFGVSFILTVVATISVEERNPLDRWKYLLYYLTIGTSVVAHVILSEKTMGLAIRAVVFGSLAIFLPLIWKKRSEYKICYSIYMGVCALSIGVFVFWPKVLGGSGYSANFKGSGIQKEILEATKGESRKDTLFERLEVNDLSYGASLIGQYNGTAEYFSVINGNVSDFYQKMYISPGIRVASFILRGLDGRKEIQALLSVSKYMDFPRGEENNLKMKENKNFLPLGYIYSAYVSEEDFLQLNPMEKASQMLDTVVLDGEIKGYEKRHIDNNLFQNRRLEYTVYQSDKENKVKIHMADEDVAKLLQQGEIYLYLQDLHGNATIYAGNKEIELKDETYIYYTGIDDYWINISEMKEEKGEYYFDFEIQGEVDFEYSKMTLFWHPVNYMGIKERNENTLENLWMTDNIIQGEVNARKGDILFLSIPYSKGWQGYVDGQEVEVLKANIGFMAIPLEEGDHHIELYYEMPGIQLGIMCTVIALIVLVVGCIWEKKFESK